VDVGEEIRGVVFSLDFSWGAIEQAKKTGANLIVTHHPAIYGKIGDLRVGDFQPLDEKLIVAIKNGISVVSMHLNLDVAVGGIDECLQRAVCGCGETDTHTSIMHPVENAGYGRAYDVEETTLGALADRLKTTLETQRVVVYGKEDAVVKKAASFCGAGGDESAVQFAVTQGADVIVSADFKHHVLALALEKGLNVIALTHYASEQFGFYQFYKKISESCGLPCVYHKDEALL
jgi:dinuclear metal center YbgI/SA1388 family protein